MAELICIVCPKGCHLQVDEGQDYRVTGNACARGAEYGRAEMTHPTRVLTSTVRIAGATHRRCPVKTNGVIPKKLIFAAMALLDPVTLQAPVEEGQPVVRDICGTGVDFVTTRALPAVRE